MHLSARRLQGGLLLVVGTAAGASALLQREREFAPYVPAAVALGLASAALLAGGAWLCISGVERHHSTSLRVLSWWWIPAGMLVIVVATWSTLAVLLAIADTSPDSARQVDLRAEAVRTALTVGAGTAGAAALLLGVRRQWLGEWAQLHHERDATEQRVTELYTAAADQLGHDKAAVRLAGIYALERVGQSNPPHRQTIVNVLCAYLRMPPASAQRAASPTKPAEHLADDPQDAEVRLAIQSILQRHLTWPSWDSMPPPDYWIDMDIDLTNAILQGFSLENCRVRAATFDGATFLGGAFLARARFCGEPWGRRGPRGVGGASFIDATFDGRTVLEDVTFDADVSFRSAKFTGEAFFGGVGFNGEADFSGAAFSEDASFEGSRFSDSANFSRVRFDRKASFEAEIMYAHAARFSGDFAAEFTDAEFHGDVSFNGVVASGEPILDEAPRTGIDLTGSRTRKVPSTRYWPDGWSEVSTSDPDWTHLSWQVEAESSD